MYVREHMTTPVISTTGDTMLDDALRTMHENKIRRMPVVENGKLIGLITRNGLREAVPNSPIALSIWGTHYQLSRMKISDVMITDVITVSPDTLLREAAAISAKEKIGTLPVVDKNNNLVGIMTTSDLYRLFTEMLGFGKKGVELRISSEGSALTQSVAMKIICKTNTSFHSAFKYKLWNEPGEILYVFLETDNADGLISELIEAGFKVEAEAN